MKDEGLVAAIERPQRLLVASGEPADQLLIAGFQVGRTRTPRSHRDLHRHGGRWLLPSGTEMDGDQLTCR